MPHSLYIELIKKVLTDEIHNPSPARRDGKDWPELGFTMIGAARLDNIQRCIESILQEGIAGDFLEAGVWKGGAAMFMKAMLLEAGINDRTVWLADSFQGLPPPNADYPADAEDVHYQHEALAISLQDVQENFRKLDLLDENVRFVQGWFHETLPHCPVRQLALLRLDGDMYESTIVTLEALYDCVSPDGYVIVDDYGYLESCRQAVHDFLQARSLQPRIEKIDWTGVFWRKSV
jgi:hypothetical protein